MHARPEFAHCLQTSKMRRNSTLLNTSQDEINIVTICVGRQRCAALLKPRRLRVIVHYDTSAMKRLLTSVSLQHEPKASDVITLVKKTFVPTSIVQNFISRGVKMRISAREACVKPHLRTRSDIKNIFC